MSRLAEYLRRVEADANLSRRFKDRVRLFTEGCPLYDFGASAGDYEARAAEGRTEMARGALIVPGVKVAFTFTEDGERFVIFATNYGSTVLDVCAVRFRRDGVVQGIEALASAACGEFEVDYAGNVDIYLDRPAGCGSDIPGVAVLNAALAFSHALLSGEFNLSGTVTVSAAAKQPKRAGIALSSGLYH
jgi:hypothetical protein